MGQNETKIVNEMTVDVVYFLYHICAKSFGKEGSVRYRKQIKVQKYTNVLYRIKSEPMHSGNETDCNLPGQSSLTPIYIHNIIMTLDY